MNRILALLPKAILKRYVLNNFSKLSKDDFFYIIKKIDIPFRYIKRNNILNKDSEILSYLLDIDKNYFEYFKKEAFSEECIKKIENSNILLELKHIDNYPFLLEREKIRENVIRNYPNLIKKLNRSQITKEIIEILENSYYIIDEEDLDKSPLFFTSDELIKRSISKNPLLILKIKEPSDELIKEALQNGYQPIKQHFIDNPNLLNSEILLMKAFENDPSMIVYFNEELLFDIVMYAKEKGYIATEEDLIKSVYLRNNQYIMQDAIKKDPKLIRWLGKSCILEWVDILEALEDYQITKDDLYNNPELAMNFRLIALLPEFELFSLYLTEKEKTIAIQKVIKEDGFLTTDKLPFLDKRFGGKVEIEKLNELLTCFNISIDENNLLVQEENLQTLDKLIDAITNIRYLKNKSIFKYPDIVTLNESINQLFKNVIKNNNYELILEYLNSLHSFVGNSISIDELKKDLDNFERFYIKNEVLNLEITNEFCNKILNQHRNFFMSYEKEKIIAEIKKELRLTEKKKNTILTGRKLNKIKNLIKSQNYQELGISKNEFMSEINDVINLILENKEIKKSANHIDVDFLNAIAYFFIKNGELDEEVSKVLFRECNEETRNFIRKKFEKVKLKYINIVSLNKDELEIDDSEKAKIGYNKQNYVIGDQDKAIKNLSDLLIKLDDETITKILNNKMLISEISYLLPFINLIDELNTNTFTNILANYDRIKDKISIGNTDNETEDYKTTLLKKIDDVIFLANAYNSVDDLILASLGEDVINELGEINSSKYFEFYKLMMSRQSGYIPPISLKTEKYNLESGRYSDPNRLLIGKRPSYESCIDLLNSAGVETYKEVLIKDTADVILIRNKNDKLISRIFIFRRGNVIQMVSKAGENLSIDLYKKIADQIMEKAISKNDNIDYIFVNYSSSSYDENCSEYNLIKDSKFVGYFPHADLSSSGFLLRSKNEKEEELHLNFDAKEKIKYKPSRKKINYNPTEEEITKLRTLRIALENDHNKKEEMSRNFEPFYFQEYSRALCGEDWYIAIKNNGNIEEVILPTNNIQTLFEIETIKKELGIPSKLKEIEDFMQKDNITIKIKESKDNKVIK